jgi:hypothetical protein
MKRELFGLLSIAALLAACGAPAGPSDEAARVFSGSVQNYTGGAAALTATTYLEDTFFGAGSVDAAGNFSFELPEGQDLESTILEPVGETVCDGVTISDPDARVVSAFFLTVADGGDAGPLIAQATSEGVVADFGLQEGSLVIRMYADRSVTVSGQCSIMPDTYNLAGRQGWNTVVLDFAEVAAGPFAGSFGTEYGTEPAPAGAGWFFVPAD